MEEVGYLIINEAFSSIINIRLNNYNIKKISINLSINQLNKNLIKKLALLIKKHDIKPEWFEFEITERLLLDKKDVYIIENIRKLGFSISIDDFGTGYSSLSLIQSLKIDKIKIDKSFIDDIENQNIYKIIIKLSEELGIEVIAEGTETLKQVQILENNNCFDFQGYYFSKPLPFSKFLSFIREDQEGKNRHLI